MPTKVKPIPKDMHTVTPSLTIADCAEAIDIRDLIESFQNVK